MHGLSKRLLDSGLVSPLRTPVRKPLINNKKRGRFTLLILEEVSGACRGIREAKGGGAVAGYHLL